MNKCILITGGAGFIGSHLGDALLARGHSVRILDSLVPQVHGPSRKRPEYLDPEIELIMGDVRDPRAVSQSLKGIDVVFHLAASVGVGQSMYELAKYTSTNNLGTAVLLESVVRNPVERLIIGSSMSIYGEGLYRNRSGKTSPGLGRSLDQLKTGKWEVFDTEGEALEPAATPETKKPSITSLYALSKFDQEQMCLMIGRAYDISAVALRFFNVFGTRQSLSNPYTGVLAIFASRYLNGRSPLIYEDGLQRRDFVGVQDVVRACCLAMEVPGAAGGVFNIGSGSNHTVHAVAEQIGKALGKEHIRPEITGKYRMGDIRHCFADISLARKVLGYSPKVIFPDGLGELVSWLQGQSAMDHVKSAARELEVRGLTV